MFEDARVEIGDIDGGENGQGADDDRPKEEFVLVHVVEEGEGESPGVFWLERKHAAAQNSQAEIRIIQVNSAKTEARARNTTSQVLLYDLLQS